jgi:hypothetical protein
VNPDPLRAELMAELSSVGDEHADLCGRAYIAIKMLTVAGERLSEAIGQHAAVNGLYASRHVGWKDQMDAETEYLAALQALRTALDGRPR